MMRAAYRIHTPRLLLSCPAPADAPAFRHLVLDSCAALAEFDQFATTNITVANCATHLRRQRAKFDTDRAYLYLAREPGGGALVGAMTLEIASAEERRATLAGWVRTAAGRCGLATEGLLAVTKVALAAVGVAALEYRCEVDNRRSVALATRAGFRYVGTQRASRLRDGVARDEMVWMLTPPELATAPAARVPVLAEDALGAPMFDDRFQTEVTHGSE